ncbi:meiosis 1 arrest protein [Rhinoderma darwinii]|uniref:meiosis 1 arrest protein n=1 Tax=Rhinoderma darwinii TaxID=43563 RepID=UPI003F66CE67
MSPMNTKRKVSTIFLSPRTIDYAKCVERMCSRPVAENIFPRVLVLDVSPPGWAAVRTVLCEALSNVLCLAAATAQPGERLSIYTVRERHQCLLPLLEIRGNLCRLQRCLSELLALPQEGTGAARNRALSPAVLDALQQNKQRMQHRSSGAALHACLVEVTIVSTRPRCDLTCDLDSGLKDADLSTLRRLLVLQISCDLPETGSCGRSPDPETSPEPGSHVYDIDIHVTLPNVLSLEIFFKSWLLEPNTEKEKCHLILPEGASHLRVMCDMNRPLLNPGLLQGDVTPPRGSALTAGTGVIQAFKVIRTVSSAGICGSLLYGPPTILTPTACWELDWDQLEANQDNFHALCKCLQSQQLSLVASCPQRSSPLLPHVLVSSSDSAALLLRPVAVRELVLLMKVPPLPATMTESAVHRVQGLLRSLDADALYNPLEISGNLYPHLQASLTQTPRRHVSTFPGAAAPSRQMIFPTGKARATIAPLHFAAPEHNKRRRPGNDDPSPKEKQQQDQED